VDVHFVGASFYDGCLKPNCSRPSSFSFRAAFLFSAAGAGAALTTCHALSQLPESLFSSTEQKIRSQNGNSWIYLYIIDFRFLIEKFYVVFNTA